MTSSCTGGAHSLLRVALALGVALHVVRHAPGTLGLTAGLVASAALLVGARDRAAAGLALIVGVAFHARGSASPAALADAAALGALLLVHLGQPPAPYGSLDARGRTDPGGGWRATPWRLPALRIAFAAHLVTVLALDAPWPTPGALLLALACVNPSWPRARRAPEPELLFYDGGCGVCHGFVRLVLAEDPEGRVARFAPLDSDCFREHVPPETRDALPDSVVLRTHDGALLTRGAAVVHLLRALGGPWGAAGAALALLPGALLDGAYDLLARVRHRIARAPDAACPLLPPELAARFEH